MKVCLPVLFLICILAGIFLIAGCQDINVDADTLKTPVFAIASGSRFYPNMMVTINDLNTGSQIRYTDDGSIPDESSTPYTVPFQISATKTIKARAFASSYKPSATATATYTIVWIQKASMPAARCNHAMVAVGDYIYVIGGFNSGGVATDTTYRYDTINNTWSTMTATLNTARARHAAAVVGTKIYVFGGYDAGDNFIGTIEELDTIASTPSWTTKTAVLNPVRADLAACTVSGTVYLMGGIYYNAGWQYLNNVDSYDSSGDSISATPPDLVSERYFLGFAVNGSTIYAIGGRSSTSDILDSYETATAGGSWTTSANQLGDTRFGHACAVGTNIYVFGGVIDGTAGNGIEKLTIAGGIWSAETYTTPAIVVYAQAVNCSGSIYLTGGDQTGDASADYSTLYLLNE
ncbi:MAG: chitobiase/beta-hexosaminidase C-terminal domain-containing protein [Spirochaetales bacterium]|nr:chitobiase/beta-hexosaminidase C-terminal domain-containing protein [Spirochaetales bacterium]